MSRPTDALIDEVRNTDGAVRSASRPACHPWRRTCTPTTDSRLTSVIALTARKRLPQVPGRPTWCSGGRASRTRPANEVAAAAFATLNQNFAGVNRCQTHQPSVDSV